MLLPFRGRHNRCDRRTRPLPQHRDETVRVWYRVLRLHRMMQYAKRGLARSIKAKLMVPFKQGLPASLLGNSVATSRSKFSERRGLFPDRILTSCVGVKSSL
jgi:hypothetical protein